MANSPHQQRHWLPAANHVSALTSPTESLLGLFFSSSSFPLPLFLFTRYEEETATRASKPKMLPNSRDAAMSNAGRRTARDGLQWPVKMYLRRLSIATGLGLAWYFSDCGRTVTQYCVCLLLCCCAPLLYANSGRESGTQTDEEAEKLWQVKATNQRKTKTNTDVGPFQDQPHLACCQERSCAIVQEMHLSITSETNDLHCTTLHQPCYSIFLCFLLAAKLRSWLTQGWQQVDTWHFSVTAFIIYILIVTVVFKLCFLGWPCSSSSVTIPVTYRTANLHQCKYEQ